MLNRVAQIKCFQVPLVCKSKKNTIVSLQLIMRLLEKMHVEGHIFATQSSRNLTPSCNKLFLYSKRSNNKYSAMIKSWLPTNKNQRFDTKCWTWRCHITCKMWFLMYKQGCTSVHARKTEETESNGSFKIHREGKRQEICIGIQNTAVLFKKMDKYTIIHPN